MIIDGNDPYREPSFTLGNRLARAVWQAVWLLLFRPTPRIAHGWRNLLLRLFGARIGKHVHIAPSVRIWAPWQLQIGDCVGIGADVRLYSMAMIRLADFVTVSQGSHLCAGSHDYNSSNFQLVARPVDIGPRVWLAADCFVGPGVTVSEGCVLGARAVLVHSIGTPWTVWAGNPARQIAERTRIAT